MNDIISREAVADAINGIECTRQTTWYEFYQKVITAVGKLPSAQPKIIRCKECRYKERKGVDYYCDHITGEEIMVSPNDYCSWAERKTDG